jgi:hypothetical protein
LTPEDVLSVFLLTKYSFDTAAHLEKEQIADAEGD